MGFFFNSKSDKKEKTTITFETPPVSVENSEPEVKEEWVWIDGYKVTDFNGNCMNNFHYEVGQQYDMPENEDIELCQNGFHFCTRIVDLATYYRFGRVFKVKGLILKPLNPWYRNNLLFSDSKAVAKSIRIIEEMQWEEFNQYFHSIPWVNSSYDYDKFKEFCNTNNLTTLTIDSENILSQWVIYNSHKELIDYNISKNLISIVYKNNLCTSHEQKECTEYLKTLLDENIDRDMAIYMWTEKVNNYHKIRQIRMGI